MKSYFPLNKKGLVLFLAFVGCLMQLHAVTFSVSPSITSNTYSGRITLDITGLTNSEKITIQTYLDLNAKGSVDDDEPFIDAFKITDNDYINAINGGIPNLNIPDN